MTHTKTLQQADLRQFTGTETWFRHPLARKVLYTEGVQYVAEQGGAYWLLDSPRFRPGDPRRGRRVLPILDADRPSRPNRHPRLRGRQRQGRPYPRNPVHRFPARCNQVLFHRQCDLVTKRVLGLRPCASAFGLGRFS